MNKEIKQEASIPVQSRVNIVSLAELSNYWEDLDYNVNTMSQLVSWSLDLLCEVLRSNEMIKPGVFNSVSKAHSYLIEKRLYQRSLKERSFKKIGTAIRFENMRKEGVDPKCYDSRGYNMIHNKEGAVQPFEGSVKNSKIENLVNIFNSVKPETKPGDLTESENVKQVENSVFKEKMTEEEFRDKKKEIELADKEQKEALDNLSVEELMKGSKVS